MADFIRPIFQQGKAFLTHNHTSQWICAVLGSLIWIVWITDYSYPSSWLAYGNNDYDLTYASLEVPRRTILDYGQFPAYNPYSAAGTDLIANPQSVHLGIFFLPALLFGSFYGYKIAVLIGYFLGIWGAAALLLRLGKPLATAVAGGMAWVSIPFFAYHILYAGHLNALYIFLLPLLMYGVVDFVLSNGRISFSAWLLSLGVWAQLALGGTSYVLIYSALFWAGCVAILCWKNRTAIPLKKWAIFVACTAIIAIGACLWKLYPSWVYMREFPRTFHDTTRVGIVQYGQMLLGVAQETESRSPTYWSWHEHAIGGGWLALLAVAAYARDLRNIFGKNTLLWCVFFGLMSWFSMGNTPNYVNPWYLLNTFFPIFDNLRVPYRAAIFPVSLLMFGFIILYHQKKKETVLWKILMLAIISQQSLMTLGVAANYRNSKKITEIASPPDVSGSFQQRLLPDSLVSDTHHAPTQMYVFLKNNIAIANTYEPLPLSPIDTTLAQRFIARGGTLAAFSPNEWRFADCHDTLILGQRFNPGWKIADGSGRLMAFRGMLAVAAPSPRLTLRFHSPNLWMGIWLSLPFWGALLAVGCWLLVLRKKQP